jgi:anti-sigma regulatory factor (Ser/Thr protein kinase)
VRTIATLAATGESPSTARALIRAELGDSDEQAVAAAELMISELVTNAVVHAATSIEIALEWTGATVTVEVRDTDPRCPVVRKPSESAPHGRGLLIVRAIAQDWGIRVREDGKSVWFSVPCRWPGPGPTP